jgi:hypothetical protein
LVKIKEQIRELRALEERLLTVSRGFCDRTADNDRSGELCSLIVGLPEEKKFRERNVSEPACFDSHYERRQGKNVHSKKTTR